MRVMNLAERTSGERAEHLELPPQEPDWKPLDWRRQLVLLSKRFSSDSEERPH